MDARTASGIAERGKDSNTQLVWAVGRKQLRPPNTWISLNPSILSHGGSCLRAKPDCKAVKFLFAHRKQTLAWNMAKFQITGHHKLPGISKAVLRSTGFCHWQKLHQFPTLTEKNPVPAIQEAPESAAFGNCFYSDRFPLQRNLTNSPGRK